MWVPPAKRIELKAVDQSLSAILRERFGEAVCQEPHTSDMATYCVSPERVKEVLRFLKYEAKPGFKRLDDCTAVDETARRDRIWDKSFAEAIPDSGAVQHLGRKARRDYPDFSMVYHLLSFDAATRIRIKAGLRGEKPEMPTITDIWPSANWYEREVFDMFGIRFTGHPNLTRILMPHDWVGHPLRKKDAGRATELPPYTFENATHQQPLDASIIMANEHKLPGGSREPWRCGAARLSRSNPSAMAFNPASPHFAA
jgi:NADH-quinone oxidoreductase subunit B/C/D